jgi:hypothetical protein
MMALMSFRPVLAWTYAFVKAVRLARPDDQCLAKKPEHRGVDQSGREQFARTDFACRKRLLDLVICEFADLARDQARTEVAVGLQPAGRTADDGGMPGQIDGVGDDGRRRVGASSGFRQHGDGVRNAQRKTAAVTSAGRHAP